jgi:hypothetical protein
MNSGIEPRFVITRPYPDSGLGSNLLSMAGAFYACERSGRELIVDWTDMSEVQDKYANQFLLCFEAIRSWRCVPVHYARQPDAPCPKFDTDVVTIEADRIGELLDGQLQTRFVRLVAFHYDSIFQRSRLRPAAIVDYVRDFYAQLVPTPLVRRAIARVESRFATHAVIGLNLRTGNGQFAKGQIYEGRVDIGLFDQPDFDAIVLRACSECVAALPRSLRVNSAIYVVTDCLSMQQRLLRLPGAFRLRSRFPPEGGGHQWAFVDETGADLESIAETVADMLLMAQCHGLVFNFTEYNRYARVMTRDFGGNARKIDNYFLPPLKRSAKRILGRLGQ